MVIRFFLRFFLALVLVSNSLVAAAASHASSPRMTASSLSASAASAASSCHEVASGEATAASERSPAPAEGLPHCCNDVGHCVCALQAHALPGLLLPLPGQSVAGLSPEAAWPSRYPVPLLRPPIR